MAQDRDFTERSYSYDKGPLDSALHHRFTGLEIVQAMQRGEVPGSPAWQTAGTAIAEVAHGAVAFTAEPAPFTRNFGGTAHGGWIATLLDSAMGLTVLSVLPVGRIHTTTELSIRYLRAITNSVALVRIEGRIIHAGRRLATAEGRVTDASGKLYAHGVTSCMILEVPGTPKG